MVRPQVDNSLQSVIRGWLLIARIPFQLVGVFPFTLGAVLAWKIEGVFDPAVFALSVAAVILIMFSTYSAGEFHDLQGDRLSAGMEKNAFSGGTQAVLKGLIPPAHANAASYLAALGAGIIGLVLQLQYQTGPWTIPLGIAGLVAGFFYSSTPLRFVKRGIGEVLIGFCYGWLPVATAFYLQTSHFSALVHWMSIPIALSIFNVIFINEFPDYPADVLEGKKNLVVRLGKKRAAPLYAAAAIAVTATFPLAILAAGAPKIIWAFSPLVAALALYPAREMLCGGYSCRRKLSKMCGITYMLNLLIPAAYILGLMSLS